MMDIHTVAAGADQFYFSRWPASGWPESAGANPVQPATDVEDH